MRPAASAAALFAITCACSPSERADANKTAETPVAAAPAGEGPQEPPLAIAADSASLKWGACPPVFTKAGCEITALHGDPAKPGADLLLRIPGGYAIPPHRHTSAERMILVSGKLAVRYQGHAEATLREGDYAFGPAGVPHEGKCTSAEACTLFIAFNGPVDAEAVAGPLG